MDVIPTPPNVETLQCNVSTMQRLYNATSLQCNVSTMQRLYNATSLQCNVLKIANSILLNNL
ncbi:exodeoxyribonuclease V 67 kD polypeptide [Fischerella thermalis JSC-11]|uniref:Exodeoxyribonuclease V 67 kD polypeptide n=1 Tax=Fischerella thermalis JSC-11 TaxID=741277 RepID=G6FTW6_9CYAN|nr:exodeoxyribonuclease V 67 kD polypeptide [Fischerella thermalis JSC-11]